MQNKIPATNATHVAVAGSSQTWTIRNEHNQGIPIHQLPLELQQASLPSFFQSRPVTASTDLFPPRDPWPFPGDDIQASDLRRHPVNSLKRKQLPLQAMLTCFFSTNDDYCLNNRDLLKTDDDRWKKIPCIAIQGGSDGICPPDTALELWEASENMELRIPVSAGHSMYDPWITHELVQATDRMAASFLSKGDPTIAL